MMLTEKKRNRFRERVRESSTIDDHGCWIWQKSRARNGYGNFSLGRGKSARAHRISYMVYVGDIPERYDVCHQCDVRPCVNPGHLFVGTRKENIQDAKAKNRLSRTHAKKGEEHAGAKLTEENVKEIRALVFGGATKVAVAKKFGVSDALVGMIHRRTAWAHLGD